VDCRDAPQVDPGASQLQQEGSATAKTDSGDPVGVRSGSGEQHVERGVPDRPHPVRVGEQRQRPVQHRSRVGEDAPAVVVHRERQVALFGQPVGAATLVVREPYPVMGEQHRRPRAGALGAGEVPDHPQAVGVVGDLTRADHLAPPPSAHRR
jgi:hypothetical protein